MAKVKDLIGKFIIKHATKGLVVMARSALRDLDIILDKWSSILDIHDAMHALEKSELVKEKTKGK